MNRKIILSLLCLLFLFSCKKERQEEKEALRYPVKFDLNGFTQTQQPIDGNAIKTNSLTTNTTTDTIPVNQLFYFLRRNSDLITQKTLIKTSFGFGVFTDDLPAGNYTAYFFGSSTYLSNASYYDISQPNVVVSPDGNAGSPIYGYNSWGDTFYKQIPIVVSSSGIVQTVQMERISAQLVFDIEDAIPANIGKIEITYDEPSIFRVYGTPYSTTTKHYVSRLLSSANAGSTNIKLYANTLSTLKPMTFSISYFQNGKNSPVDTKIVTVTSQPNKRTVISGKLFNGNSVFDITYDTNWDTVIVGY